MGRTYKPKLNKSRPYNSSPLEDLVKAADDVKKGKTVRQAASFGVAKSTLSDYLKRQVNGLLCKPAGGQQYVSTENEKLVVNLIDNIADWGFPLGFEEVRYLLKSLLDRQGIVSQWKDNIPGRD